MAHSPAQPARYFLASSPGRERRLVSEWVANRTPHAQTPRSYCCIQLLQEQPESEFVRTYKETSCEVRERIISVRFRSSSTVLSVGLSASRRVIDILLFLKNLIISRGIVGFPDNFGNHFQTLFSNFNQIEVHFLYTVFSQRWDFRQHCEQFAVSNKMSNLLSCNSDLLWRQRHIVRQIAAPLLFSISQNNYWNDTGFDQ